MFSNIFSSKKKKLNLVHLAWTHQGHKVACKALQSTGTGESLIVHRESNGVGGGLAETAIALEDLLEKCLVKARAAVEKIDGQKDKSKSSYRAEASSLRRELVWTYQLMSPPRKAKAWFHLEALWADLKRGRGSDASSCLPKSEAASPGSVMSRERCSICLEEFVRGDDIEV